MPVIAIHIEDEKDWREIIRKDLLEIDNFDISNLKSVSSVTALRKVLPSLTGNLIIIMDLRLGGQKNTNFNGFHWLLEDLPDLLNRNASTTVYVVSGRLGENEIAREILLRQGIPEERIFDKGYWERERERFISVLKDDIARMDDIAFQNIAERFPGNRIDPYLIHTHRMIKNEKNSNASEQDGSPPDLPVLPMLVKTDSKNWDYHEVPDIKILGHVENIYVCLGNRKTIAALERDPHVISVESSRPAMKPECEVSVPFVKGDSVHNDLSEKGDKALVGIIDTGIDVLHEAFLESTKTKSRILAIWDQTDPTGPTPAEKSFGSLPDEFNFGTLHSKESIDSYLRKGSVPKWLIPPAEDHGTHVASIAAGQKTKHFAGGMAPEARIIVVIPADEFEPGKPNSLGYSASHIVALQFIKEFALRERLPVVINVSQGMNAGAHDGSSNLEVAFDAITGIGKQSGIVVVKSAGNERDKSGHSFLQIANNGTDALEWNSQKEHQQPDVIELWFDPADKLQFRLADPYDNKSIWVNWTNPSVNSSFSTGNAYNVSYVRYDPDNGHSKLLVTIGKGSKSTISLGKWALLIEGLEVNSQGGIHAWIERRNNRPIYFLNHISEDYTLSIPGTAHSVIAVGSIQAVNPVGLARSSSYGPTRDGRKKPDLCAPGENIVAALSGMKTGAFSLSGTSMAAPHVSGAIALLLSHAQKVSEKNNELVVYNAAQIIAALVSNTQNYRGVWNRGMGYGVLDSLKFIQNLGIS